MILIALSWAYILFTTINQGLLLCKILKLKTSDISIVSVLGLFLVTITATIWVVFGNISWQFHIALLSSNIAIAWFLKHKALKLYSNFIFCIKQLTPALKILLALNIVLIIAQCASPPYVIDNESYYIQTIKWINEYGLVKGVGNVHFYLAQTSGWHIAQSALNFSFLYPNFNDLSGFCLMLGTLFSFFKLNSYLSNKKLHYLFIGLFPLANVFFFQFISAPSPDIPIYVFSFIIFFYFIECYNRYNRSQFIIIVLLVLFCLYIKTTAIALTLLPLILFIKHLKQAAKALPLLISSSFLILVLFVTKNTIISGYPLFPVVTLDFDLNHKIPEAIAGLYYEKTKLYAFFLPKENYEAMHSFEIFKHWISLPKLHGFFNKIGILLLIITPFFIYRYFNNKTIWWLYAVMLIQMMLLYSSSPQYRFFMNFLLLYTLMIASLIIKKKQYIYLSHTIAIAVVMFVVIVPLKLNNITHNRFTAITSNFKTDYLLFPHKNSKYNTGYKKIKESNFYYYSPDDNEFLWGTGDGPLPCVNTKQVEKFKRKYGIVPQMRGNTLNEGFYSLDIKRKNLKN